MAGNVDPQDVVVIPSSEYGDSVCIDDYRGQWSIVACQVNDEGYIYKRWCFSATRDKQPAKRSIPWKINLGDPKTAIVVLEKLLDIARRKAGIKASARKIAPVPTPPPREREPGDDDDEVWQPAKQSGEAPF